MRCKDGKIPWLASHSDFFSVSFCPFPSPASSLAPREEQGPPFLQKLPKSSAMYYVETNKIEESMTSSRLSPVKSDRQERHERPLLFCALPLPPLLLCTQGTGPKQGGGDFSNRNLPWGGQRGLLSKSPSTAPYPALPTLCSSSNSHALSLQGLCGPPCRVFPSSDFK